MGYQDNDAVIVAAGRSAIGRARKGALKDTRPDDLAATIVAGITARVPGLYETGVDDLILGCAEPYGEQGFNLARQVAVLNGHDDVPGVTVNRFCASSLQATRMAFHAIRSGEGDAFVVAGVEAVSRFRPMDPAENPLFEPARGRVLQQIESGADWVDPRGAGGVPDAYIPMGLTAEFVARATGTTREEQDSYALRSQQRAAEAREAGHHAREIIPFTLADGTVFDMDESPRPETTAEALSSLSPAFTPAGSVTAGNSCPLNDGAAAAVVLSGRRARELGVAPLARVASTGVSALSPEIMGLGPVGATRQALLRAGLQASDLDAVELNEAFAAQVVPSIRELGLDEQIVNPHGGAIALGHPFGATGVRMVGSLINDLRVRDGQWGLATLCIGGGQGMALVLERL